MRYFLILSFTMIALFGCASGNRKAHDKLKSQARAGDLAGAMATIKSDDFYPDKNSRLLKLMEESLLHHLQGNYYQAMLGFDQAKELSDQLFTASISKKVASAVVNSNADNYYGETYERSMIRFYQSLNHYSLSQEGNYEAYVVSERDAKGKILREKEMPAVKLTEQQKRFHLTASRSTLLEWNSLLDNYKSTSGGKPVYKDDLMAKIFGAFIHEQMGDAQNKAIALGLYKEAKNVLFRNYNILPTYNKKSDKFVKDFDKLALMNEDEVRKNYVEKTPSAPSLESFIDSQIVRLSNGNEQNSVFILLENNFISPKQVKKFDFPLPAPAVSPGGDFVAFCSNVLNAAAKAAPKIYFEMPEISAVPVIEDQMINIKDSTGKVVATKNLVTVNPLSDLARFTLAENALSNYAKVGTRVALKHVTALVAAYAVYKKSKGYGEALAAVAGSASYTAANKLIEASEEADLRSWSLLPSTYSLTAFSKLQPGNYTVEYLRKGVAAQNLGALVVTKADKPYLFKQRIY